MVKRRAKRNVKTPVATDEEEIDKIIHHEVERRTRASEAIRDAETEHLLSGLRLLRSNLNNEQLQTPILQYLKENMPNLTLKINEVDGEVEVGWQDKDGNLSVSEADWKNMHESFLRQITNTHPDFAAAGMPSVGGFEFSSKTVNTTDILSTADFPDFVMEEPSESQNPALQNAFHTPGANSQRLSVGMTPKTLRLPKPGETLLSVRGSPLGVYKDDNMEAIRESEEE